MTFVVGLGFALLALEDLVSFLDGFVVIAIFRTVLVQNLSRDENG